MQKRNKLLKMFSNKVLIVLFLSLICFAIFGATLSEEVDSIVIDKKPKFPTNSAGGFGCGGPMNHNDKKCNDHCIKVGVSNLSLIKNMKFDYQIIILIDFMNSDE